MKTFKRVLSVVIVMAMIFTSLPVMAQGSGVETSVNVTPDTATADRITGSVLPSGRKEMTVAASDELVYGTDGVITRAQWLHNLAVVFEMTVETMAAADNYYSDLSEEHTYYTDIILATSFGVVDIEAGLPIYPDEPLTREFAASTLNFCLGYSLDEGTEYTFSDHTELVDPLSAQIAVNRGWFELIDSSFSSSLTVTEAEVRFMLDDAAAVLAATEIDENYENTYGFTDDVIIVPDGTEASKDENGRVTIADSPVEISVGDKFAVFYNSIPVVATALSVDTFDNITTIETETVASEEAFTSVDAQGKAHDMEFIPADGVDMTISEKTDGMARASGTADIQSVDLTGNFKILDGIDIFLNVTLENPEINYKVNDEYGYVALVSDAEVTYGVTCDPLAAKGKDSVTLLKVNVGGVGSFTVEVEVELSGSVNGYVSGVLTAGLEYTRAGGLREVRSFYQTGSGCNSDFSAAVGLKASFGVTELPFVSAYLYIRMGIKANVKKTTWTFAEESGTCVNFNGYLYGEYGGYASVDLGKLEFSFNPKVEFYHAGNSPVRIIHHYEDGVEVASCTQGNSSFNSYYTNSSSSYAGSGWNGCDGAYGVDSLGFKVPLYEYRVDSSKNVTITKFKGNYYTVNLPSTIDGMPVVSVGAYAFEEKGVVRLHIPSGITKIENYAFENCGGIKSIVIPDTVTQIFSNAFEGCTSLKDISIPSSVKQIDPRAFSNTALTKIEIPKTLESGGANGADGPFADCKDLKEITFEEGITKIPQNIFSHCDSIEKIIIPDTVTTISSHAFNGCENLKRIEFSDSVSIIEPYAFKDCISLYHIDLPDSLTTIEREAFKGCTGLTAVEFPDDLSYIAQGAFINCENLVSVKLPANITQFGDEVFANTALTEIEIPKSLDKCLGSSRRGPFTDCEALKKVTFEPGCESIPEKLFAGCSGLEEITIPDTVKVIETSAFLNCSNLKKVTIPETVEAIEPYAFQTCSSLTEIDLPDSLTEISIEVFRKCSSLRSVKIPDGVTHISNMAFYECSALSSVELPDSLVRLGEYAFSRTALCEINIPKSLDVTVGYVFYGCDDLKAVTFEKGSDQIAERLLQGCNGIEEVIVPDTVKIIENLAFANCGNLKKVFIPDSVTDIYPNAFNNSPNVIIEGHGGSYAQPFAQNNGISFVDVTPFRITSVDNYTVTIDGIKDIKEIRFAIGHYTTGSEVKAAEKNVTLDAATVAKYTVDGVMTYDLPWMGEYTFWVRLNDGSSYFLYTEINDITPYVESYGVKMTVKDYAENYKDMWLAEGTFNSYSEIKASTGFKYQASANKLDLYAKTTHDFSYTMTNPGPYTVLIRYNDGTADVIHHTLTVDYPEFKENGLQVTVTNIPDIKIIRTAYGHYESVSEIKAATGVRNFSNKNDIKNAESYMIQYRDEGEVTLIVEYNNGYK
ncbi:MAG: leucine-rich repeat protein, partial [Clostridia bacterium]|nr:leucine-rich repeat protein [Clostridia bacterium]